MSVTTLTESTERQSMVEQQIVAEIQKLWPNARKSSKELGEHLVKLQETCRDKGDRFGRLLKTLGIPRSTAYHYMAIHEDCLIVDFVFPANVVAFSATASIDVTDLGNRKVLMGAYKEAGSPENPDDSQALTIVGSAAAAIAAATAKANAAPPPTLTLLQECLAQQDGAFQKHVPRSDKGNAE